MGSTPPEPGAEPAARVLVVDDEPAIGAMLAAVLGYHGYQVTTVTDGAQALRHAERWRPDLLILDVMLPDMDGFAVCRQLRALGHRAGIVFLTARDAPRDMISGLTLGGDDYVTKPFSVDELLARTRAVLRRTRGERLTADGAVLRFADVELDEDTCEVRRAGRLVPLSPTEYKLLRYLMRNPNLLLTRGQILDAVWSYDFGGGSNVVDTYIGYLRRKLDPLGPPLIVTQRGFGYALREQPR